MRNNTLMHIKVNVYASTVTLTSTHTSLTSKCAVDLNGLCGGESSTIKCVFVQVSQRLFQSQINLKAPLPDHRREEWRVTG